ncbi:MAG TPA: DUF72 domain-containing protein [Nitrososphaeraceae archaeon]
MTTLASKEIERKRFLISKFKEVQPFKARLTIKRTGIFYPDMTTKRLRFYSQFFNTAEMDSIFYEKFYSHMTKGTFIGMVKATPDKFVRLAIKPNAIIFAYNKIFSQTIFFKFPFF